MVNKNVIMLLIIALVAAVAAVGIILYSDKIQTAPVASLISETKTGEDITPLAATGNIDDAVSSFLKEIDDEQSVIDDVAIDKSLFFSDTQEISDFSQSVNENEF